MENSSLRWGILGCANIARKNWKAIWNSGNGRVAGVAGREPERTRCFIQECQACAAFDPAPRAFANYEQLLAAKDIDAVYIPLPTAVRGQWVKRAAEAGKHIVCEKPCATSVAELSEVLELCRRNKVQFLDGVMFMHSRRLARMREMLDDGQTVGSIRRIANAFCFRAAEGFYESNIRAQGQLEPYGCLGDLGWYCIRFALWAMDWKLPVRVRGELLSEFKHPASPSPVPTEFSGELIFEGGVSSSFFCSFLTDTEQWARISGTRGFLRLQDFVLPFSGRETAFDTGRPTFEVKGCDFEMRPHDRRWSIEECSHADASAQESQLFRNFAAQVQTGTLNPLWPEVALKTQQVMEACRNDWRGA
jgi:predicted dehydrogenase